MPLIIATLITLITGACSARYGSARVVVASDPMAEVVCVHRRHSALSRGPRLLEEILRWGTTQLFDTSAAASRGVPPAHEAAKPQEADEKAEAMDVDDTDKAAPGNAHGMASPRNAIWQSAPLQCAGL